MDVRPAVLPTARSILPAAAAALLLTLAACGGSDSPSEPPSDTPRPTAVVLSQPSLSFASLGVERTLTASVFDQHGAEMPGAGVSWSSSDAGVASVSGGVVTSVGNGTARVTAMAGSASAEAQVTVDQVLVALTLSEPAVMLTLGEAPTTVHATATDANGHPGPTGSVVWSSGDPAVVSVGADGACTPVAPGWALLQATAAGLTGSAPVNVRAPGFPAPAPAVRALHLGGNWLGNELHGGTPHAEYWDFLEGLDANWVGVSVALHYGPSTDPTVSRRYEGVGIRTFTDDVLRTLIRSFTQRGVSVYVTLAFEPDPAPGVPERWLLGQPWLEGGFQADDWPWLPTHPDHDAFVAAFWGSYTEQAVHFARIAGEEGAAMFSLGTETDRLFRTRTEGPWVTEFGDEIRAMVAAVREVFDGAVTYDQVYSVLTEPTGFWGTTAPRALWSDAGLDAIGISAYYRLLPTEPSRVSTVAELQAAWEGVLSGTLAPLRQANPGLPVYFTEVGYVDDVRAPGNPTVEEFETKVFRDGNGNGLDDGQETQANVYEAFYRALQRHPVVDGIFLWDHAMDANAEIEHESRLLSTRVRGKLAEEVIRLAYRGGG